MRCGDCGNDEYSVEPCDIEVDTLDTIYEVKCKECLRVAGYMKFTYTVK